METAIVRTRALTKRYGSTIGVDDLDLELLPGEIFGFIGPNGAGKTTTIRLLLDLIRPTSGSAAVFGLDAHRSAVAIRHRVGYLPGRLTLYDRMTPADLFDWLGRFRPRYERRHALELAERLSLDPSRRIGELSSGNRQKVGLVQAFMHRPELLILDEPTSGLDPLVRRQFRGLLVNVKAEGATTLLSSHVLAEVEDICDRVGTIVDGRLQTTTTVEDLRHLSRRHLRVSFAGDPPTDRLAALPEVRNLTVAGDPADETADDRAGGRPAPTVVELDVVGPLDRLVKEISIGQVVDLTSRAMSLEEVFLETYDGNRRAEPIEPAGEPDAADAATAADATTAVRAPTSASVTRADRAGGRAGREPVTPCS